MLWSLLMPRTKIVSFGCYGCGVCCVCCAGKCGGTCVGGSEAACGALILHQGVRLWVSCAAVGGCQRTLHHRRSAGRSSQLTNFCSIEAAMPLWWHCSQSNTTRVGNKKTGVLVCGEPLFSNRVFFGGMVFTKHCGAEGPAGYLHIFHHSVPDTYTCPPRTSKYFTFIFFVLLFMALLRAH